MAMMARRAAGSTSAGRCGEPAEACRTLTREGPAYTGPWVPGQSQRHPDLPLVVQGVPLPWQRTVGWSDHQSDGLAGGTSSKNAVIIGSRICTTFEIEM
jgi:hypothetical protein